MPTVFFISRDEKKKSILSIEDVAKIIAENAKNSKFLSGAGSKTLLQKKYQRVAILIESVYCFDTEVQEKAFKYIDDFLRSINLREYFYVSREGSAPTMEKLADIWIPPEYQKKPVVGFSISLSLKMEEHDLYREPHKVVTDMTNVGDAIQKILNVKNLRIDIEHNHNKGIHTFKFSFGMKNEMQLLHFKGAVVLSALKAVGLDSEYKINDFDLNAFYELLRKITEDQLPKAVEQKLEINSDDEALYSDKIPESKHDVKDTKLDNFIKAYSLPDTSTPNIEKALRLAAKNNNVKDIQFILINFPNVNINKQDENTDSQKAALHWAVIERATDCVRVLLDRGAKWDIPDAYEKTAADYATKSNAEIQLLFASMKTVDKEAEYSNDAFQFN